MKHFWERELVNQQEAMFVPYTSYKGTVYCILSGREALPLSSSIITLEGSRFFTPESTCMYSQNEWN